MFSEWHLSIARPDFADWVTVAAYCLAAMFAARATRDAARVGDRSERRFWLISTLLLILLGVNELLDLQTLATSIARAHAKLNGWYDARRAIQYSFVVALGFALVVAIGLAARMRNTRPAVRLALAGFAFIGLFVFARAASIHHLEEILGSGPTKFNFGSIQEMIGILVVLMAATLYTKALRLGD